MKEIVSKSKLDNLANSISAKSKVSTPMTIDQMKSAVDSIVISQGVSLQSKEVSPTESVQNITPDTGYDGLSQVNVGAISSNYIGSNITRNPTITVSNNTVTIPSGYYSASQNKTISHGTVTVSNLTFSSSPSITVNNTGLITASLQSSESIGANVSSGYIDSEDISQGTVTINSSGTKQLTTQAGGTFNPTESEQTIVAANRYTTGAIKIGAISSSYIGSGVTRRDSQDLSAEANTVTAPAGYYSTDVSMSIDNGSATTPATTITANPSISINSLGLITSTVSTSKNITPTVTAGYISTGTAGSVTVSGSATNQLTTQGGSTVTPTKSSQQIVTAGTYVTGNINVAAIPSNYITTNDADAIAGDISLGKTAYVDGNKITGTLEFINYYTGTSQPTSALGSNGDIYLKAVSN